MGLKLADVAQQLSSIERRIREDGDTRNAQLLSIMAYITENSSFQGYSPSSCPADYTVIATDGSQIDVDRHESTGCYLINVGWAIISYGPEPTASLDKRAEVSLKDERGSDYHDSDDDYQEIKDRLNIGLERSLAEFRRLAELTAKRDRRQPCLAMVDGPLVLWGAAGASSQNKQGKQYYDQMVEAMEQIYRHALDGPLALVGYTSYPGYRDIVEKLPATEKDLLLDRHIFGNLLEPGQRSIPFKVERSWGPDHEMYFFYLKTESEIARIEVPKWVAEDPYLLDTAHAAILDQCTRGHGYPVALQEAHEQAVVTAADRENFWNMVSGVLNRRGFQTTSSAKSRSKRSRWL